MYDLIRPAGIEQSDSGEPVVDKTSTNNADSESSPMTPKRIFLAFSVIVSVISFDSGITTCNGEVEGHASQSISDMLYSPRGYLKTLTSH